MRTLSTRTLSALAYDRGQEYVAAAGHSEASGSCAPGRSHSTRAHASWCPAWRPLPPATHRLRPSPDLTGNAIPVPQRCCEASRSSPSFGADPPSELIDRDTADRYGVVNRALTELDGFVAELADDGTWARRLIPERSFSLESPPGWHGPALVLLRCGGDGGPSA